MVTISSTYGPGIEFVGVLTADSFLHLCLHYLCFSKMYSITEKGTDKIKREDYHYHRSPLAITTPVLILSAS